MMESVSAPVETGDRVLSFVAPMVAVVVGTIARASTSIYSSIFGADSGASSFAAYGSTAVAVLGFAGLLVRQLVQSNGAWKEIVSSLQDQLSQEQQRHAYTRWEVEQERYLAGKRDSPGPAPTFTTPRSAP